LKGLTQDEQLDGQPADSRDAILVAACRAVAEQGIRGMRLEAVAREAGVSVPLVYYHFESRPGLIRAVLRYVGAAAPSEVLRERPPGFSAYEALEAALISEIDDEPRVRDASVIWGEVNASAVFDPKLRDELRRVNRAWSALVAEAIESGIADGSVDPTVDPAVAAELLISLVDGLCARWLGGTLEVERARRLVAAALRAALAPRRASDSIE